MIAASDRLSAVPARARNPRLKPAAQYARP